MPQPVEVFVSAVEPSGDQLAAEVLTHVQAVAPHVSFFGACGPRLRALGGRSVVDSESLAVMGISAVLARAPTLLRARRRLQAALASAPRVALFVDGPSLHLPLARTARAAGVRTIGLVCPQIWAWKPDRTATIGAAYDHLLCLFDFEPALVRASCAVHGSRVSHVGHPIVDRLPAARCRHPSPTPHFGLAPGSRPQELARHVPGYLAVAEHVRRRVPEARVTWLGARPSAAPGWLEVADSVADLQPCHAVLTKSGTITLELAWMGTPQVVAHEVSALTHAVGRALVRHVDHIALPNVLCRRAVVPEHLGRIQPAALAAALLAQVGAPPIRMPGLGPPGATARAAGVLLDALEPAGPPPAGGPSGPGRLPEPP